MSETTVTSDERIDASSEVASATQTTAAQSFTVAAQQPGWNVTEDVASFNPSLGKLVSVNVTFLTHISGSLGIENMGTTAETVSLTESGIIEAVGPAKAFDLNNGAAHVSVNRLLAAYDGRTDFGGPSGFSENFKARSRYTDVERVRDPSPYEASGHWALSLHGKDAEMISGLANAVSEGTLLVGGTVEVSYTYIPCFAAGTRIATDRGEIAVEALRPGDIVTSVLRHRARVLRTTFTRVACTREDMRPVRIAAGAFGPGLPRRALTLSPDHAVYAEGTLIPVRHLVDGRAVMRAPIDLVTYWHVELDQHDVILAEGLPAESWLDVSEPARAAEGGRGNAVARLREAAACAPFAVAGPLVDALRARLARAVVE